MRTGINYNSDKTLNKNIFSAINNNLEFYFMEKYLVHLSFREHKEHYIDFLLDQYNYLEKDSNLTKKLRKFISIKNTLAVIEEDHLHKEEELEYLKGNFLDEKDLDDEYFEN